MNKQISKTLILFAATAIFLTACAIHIPEVSPADRQARMDEASSLISANGRVSGNAVKGQFTYTEMCLDCHGEKGRNENSGDSDSPEYTGTSANNDPRAFFEITNFGDAKRKMPGFYDELTLGQIVDILAYAQTLPTK